MKHYFCSLWGAPPSFQISSNNYKNMDLKQQAPHFEIELGYWFSGIAPLLIDELFLYFWFCGGEFCCCDITFQFHVLMFPFITLQNEYGNIKVSSVEPNFCQSGENSHFLKLLRKSELVLTSLIIWLQTIIKLASKFKILFTFFETTNQMLQTFF